MKASINLHIHTIHSDGKKTVAEIIDGLKVAGVEFFSITDHDEVCGNIEAAELARKHGLNYCNGIELSCCFDGEAGFDNTDPCHILGFGIDIDKMQIERKRIKKERDDRLRNRSIPKVAEGIDIIAKCGGVAVWAHPFEIIRTIAPRSYRKEDVPRHTVAEIAKYMSAYGLNGIEAYYQSYTKSQIEFLEILADEYNFLRSCGTDYHGRNNDQLCFHVKEVEPIVTIASRLFHEPSIELSGGRTTEGVVKIADTVRRPHKDTSDYANEVLTFLRGNNFSYCPEFLGIDESGRNTYTYIDGFVPDDIGNTTIEQLCTFMKIVREFHDRSTIFLNSTDKVLCHNDLSPCNTIFLNKEPVAIIDWDDVSVGERWQDLVYIIWLWINIGSHKRDEIDVIRQMKKALFSYGADEHTKTDFADKLIWRMDKALAETPITGRHYAKIKDWVEFSKLWVIENKMNIKNNIG